MYRMIASLILLIGASESFAQEILFYRTVGGPRIMRVSSDGSGLTTIVTLSQVAATMQVSIPNSTDWKIGSSFDVDAPRGHVYFVGTYQDIPSEELFLPILLRCDLDGSNIIAVFTPEQVQAFNGEKFESPKVLEPISGIPAVGGVGLGIMVASLIAAAGWVLSRRKSFANTA